MFEREDTSQGKDEHGEGGEECQEGQEERQV